MILDCCQPIKIIVECSSGAVGAKMGSVPSKPRREDTIVEMFLSAYRDRGWRGCRIDWPDRVQDGGVDALATRFNSETLAIEHTLIEPFIGEREDFARFKPYLEIETDSALRRADHIVYVNVPNGSLPKGSTWGTVVSCVHEWLRANLHSAPLGDSYHDCEISGSGVAVPFTLRLQVQVVLSLGSKWHPIIRRYGLQDLDGPIVKALTTKLPKLCAADAKIRILLLERNQFSLSEKEIWQKVNEHREEFPLLQDVTEIWFAETVFYDSSPDPRWRDALAFKRFDLDNRIVESMEFFRGVLISWSRDGVAFTTPESLEVLGGT